MKETLASSIGMVSIGGAATALLALALGGCAGAGRSADLVKDVRGYSDGVRWRDFERAALRIQPARRSEFMDQREDLDDDLRVADWDMKRLKYDKTKNRAVVEIKWTWLLDSRGIVHTTVTRQNWSLHGKRWLLDREIRVRGEPMPGVAEQPDPGDGGHPDPAVAPAADRGLPPNRSNGGKPPAAQALRARQARKL